MKIFRNTLFGPTSRPGIALLLTGLILAGSLIGCAKKGPVRPKLASLPAAPQAPLLEQRGDQLLLSWQAPDKNQDGGDADDLAGFHILRRDYAAADGCPGCREPDDLQVRIRLDYPVPAQRIGDRFYWLDERVAVGRGYRYFVLPVTVGRQRGEPADLQAVLQQAPPAPSDLSIQVEEGRLRLTWQAPVLGDGMALIGYNLYRRQTGRSWPLVPLNPQPLTANTLTDVVAADGGSYNYRIGALVRSGDTVIESRLTEGKHAVDAEP